ncbi:MAG: histidine phosphatase family protein [Clostridia bacterium]|nr:histidine phosphatase family protein [Clostridia bacterium]
MKILLIRHGEPDYSIDSLTEKGWFEAELLSRRLIKTKIDDFYCSPLGRAKDTSKAALHKLNRSAEILPWLREFSGAIPDPDTQEKRIPWDLEPSLWANEEIYYDRLAWMDGKLMKNGNVSEIYRETTAGIDELLSRYGMHRHGMIYRCDRPGEITVALFCHFAMAMTIISYLTGISAFILWHNFFMPASSVTTLVTETDRNDNMHFRCVQIGDTSHLYAVDEDMSLSGLYPF